MANREAPKDVLEMLYQLVDEDDFMAVHKKWSGFVKENEAYSAWYYSKKWQEEDNHKTDGTA